LGGQSGEQIMTAARALVLGQFPSDADQIQAVEAKLPALRAQYDAPRWLPTAAAVKIAQNAPADFLKASSDDPAKLYFRLAPDLYFGSRATVPLRLAYTISGLGSNMRARLAIGINGETVISREIEIQRTAAPQEQSFAIPASLLYPSNTLIVNFAPLDARGLPSVEEAPPQLLVSRNSELDLGAASHYVRLPRMDLFASAGFPFTRFADLRQTVLVLPESPSGSQISLCLDLLGFLGLQTGYPALGIQFMDAVRASRIAGKDLLVVGSGHDQPLFSQWSALLPVIPADGRFLLNTAGESLSAALNKIPFVGNRGETALADLLNGDTHPNFVLEQLPVPFSEDATAVIVASSSADGDLSLPAMLTSASKDGSISDNVVVVNDRRFESFRFRLQPFYVGDANWQIAFEYWMRFHVWLMPILVVIAAFLVGRRWELFLERQVSKRLAAGS